MRKLLLKQILVSGTFLSRWGFSALPLILAGLVALHPSKAAAQTPFVEANGQLVIEAENYHSKSNTGTRDWIIFPTSSSPKPDPDPAHTSGASNGKYVEILPDTRVDHDDPLVQGVSFNATGAKAARMNYRILITSPGRYYVRARAFSTGTEDNGVHFGVNDTWPLSGTSLQWCDGKNQWTWSGARRTTTQHCGVANGLYLDLTAGEHTLMVGMREDGVELDRYILTTTKSYFPSGIGPAESPRGGTRPNQPTQLGFK